MAKNSKRKIKEDIGVTLSFPFSHQSDFEHDDVEEVVYPISKYSITSSSQYNKQSSVKLKDNTIPLIVDETLVDQNY